MEYYDLNKFTAILIAVGELYGKTISEMLTELYWQSLKSFALTDIKQAFNFHINNPDVGQYFPKPADLVRFIEGSAATKALQAWINTEKAILKFGAYQSIIFDDPLIHAVIAAMGGWIKLCATPSKELQFYAHEFQRRYMIFVDKPPEIYPKYCCGLIEYENDKKGFPIKSRLFVGDVKKTKQIMCSAQDPEFLINDDDFLKNINT